MYPEQLRVESVVMNFVQLLAHVSLEHSLNSNVNIDLIDWNRRVN